ncbi:sulfatase-like hydrolase/transferase [Rhodococcus koreensis]|uniref:sulfatase-like hydrolase/transferase n=1 Tax=Rhodococcus koreensis TaxID=99653 RepID=UPI001F1258A5|nr:sulfatase-like hydrolase/transferase [Rhodococcus koreensis]
MSHDRPNIVFVLMDNLGYGEVGCYGGGAVRGAPTPRIDRLARDGMKLTNFNVEPQCTPSRSALLTGRFALRSGTHSVSLTGAPYGLVQWEITLPKLLAEQGYATGHFGKWHLGNTRGACPPTRVSTSGTASPTPPTKACGRAHRASTRTSRTWPTSWKAARASRRATSRSTT